MRQPGVGTYALTMALTVGMVRCAQGQIPPGGSQGGLITRYFKRPAVPRIDKNETALLETPSVSPLAQAQADWLRRQEVCLRLRDIAHETGDDALWRKADQLEQRAWDAFVQQTGRSPATPAADEARLRPATDSGAARSRLLRSADSTRRGSRDPEQAAVGEER